MNKKMKFVVELDGNALCIKREDFVNLQISPAYFVGLTHKQVKEIKKLMDIKTCVVCGGKVIGYTDARGMCDDCDKKASELKQKVGE